MAFARASGEGHPSPRSSTLLIRYGSAGWRGKGATIPSTGPAPLSASKFSSPPSDSPLRITRLQPASLAARISCCCVVESSPSPALNPILFIFKLSFITYPGTLAYICSEFHPHPHHGAVALQFQIDRIGRIGAEGGRIGAEVTIA